MSRFNQTSYRVSPTASPGTPLPAISEDGSIYGWRNRDDSSSQSSDPCPQQVGFDSGSAESQRCKPPRVSGNARPTQGYSLSEDLPPTMEGQFYFILHALIGLSEEHAQMVINDFGITTESEAFALSLADWRSMNEHLDKPLKPISLIRLAGLGKWFSSHLDEYTTSCSSFLTISRLRSYQQFSYMLAGINRPNHHSSDDTTRSVGSPPPLPSVCLLYTSPSPRDS